MSSDARRKELNFLSLPVDRQTFLSYCKSVQSRGPNFAQQLRHYKLLNPDTAYMEDQAVAFLNQAVKGVSGLQQVYNGWCTAAKASQRGTAPVDKAHAFIDLSK